MAHCQHLNLGLSFLIRKWESEFPSWVCRRPLSELQGAAGGQRGVSRVFRHQALATSCGVQFLPSGSRAARPCMGPRLWAGYGPSPKPTLPTSPVKPDFLGFLVGGPFKAATHSSSHGRRSRAAPGSDPGSGSVSL